MATHKHTSTQYSRARQTLEYAKLQITALAELDTAEIVQQRTMPSASLWFDMQAEAC